MGRIIASARAELGPLSLLVNNASMFESDSPKELDADLWQRQFAVNLEAPIALARDFEAQAIRGSDASIVNILDQRVWRLNPQFFSYTLTKSALWTATQTMAQAFAPHVRVNAVGPGPTLANWQQSRADFERESTTIPLGRGVSTDEIADAVLFLAQARSVTGQMIAVDGGQHLAWETPDFDRDAG